MSTEPDDMAKPRPRDLGTSQGAAPARRSLDLPKAVEEAELEGLYRRHAAGDRTAVLRAIAFCGNQAIPMPEWVVAGYFKAMNQWWSYRVKSLDEAFDLRVAKGTHFDRLRELRQCSGAIYLEVKSLHLRGHPINSELFSQVGKKYGFGKTKTEEFYRHGLDQLASISSAATALLLDPFSTPQAKVRRATRTIRKLSGSRSKNT